MSKETLFFFIGYAEQIASENNTRLDSTRFASARVLFGKRKTGQQSYSIQLSFAAHCWREATLNENVEQHQH